MVILGIIYDCFANIIPGGIRRGLDYGFFNAKDLRLHLVEVERRPAGWFFAYREIHVGYYIYIYNYIYGGMDILVLLVLAMYRCW